MTDMSAHLRAEGYTGQVEFDGSVVTILRDGWRARLGHGRAPRKIPVERIARVDWEAPALMTNGTLRFAVPGEVDPQMLSDRNAVVFLKKQAGEFERIRDAVAAELGPDAESMLIGAPFAGLGAKDASPVSYAGHRANATEYAGKGLLGVRKPIAGALAYFESGAEKRRSTVTRIGSGAVLAGPLGAVGGALLRKDTSKCYVTVVFSDGDSLVIEGPVKDERKMRLFAAGVNRLGA